MQQIIRLNYICGQGAKGNSAMSFQFFVLLGLLFCARLDALSHQWQQQYIESALDALWLERSNSSSCLEAEHAREDLESIEECILSDEFHHCLDLNSNVQAVFQCVDSWEHQFCRRQVLRARFLNYFRDELIPGGFRNSVW